MQAKSRFFGSFCLFYAGNASVFTFACICVITELEKIGKDLYLGFNFVFHSGGGVRLRIGIYAFSGSGELEGNFAAITRGIIAARQEKLRLLAFHECALTGYPPLEIAANRIDYEKAEAYMARTRAMAQEGGLYIAVGMAMRRDQRIYNCLRLAAPDGSELPPYEKRALWGWDAENFSAGAGEGLYEIDGYKIGLRLCFEVRFPEYFRALYRKGADFCIVSFCDIQPSPSPARYELMRGILQTRAMENLIPMLSVNDARAYASAPSAYFDRNGNMVSSLMPEREGLLYTDFMPAPLTFGEQGRAVYSDCLTGRTGQR